MLAPTGMETFLGISGLANLCLVASMVFLYGKARLTGGELLTMTAATLFLPVLGFLVALVFSVKAASRGSERVLARAQTPTVASRR